MAARPDYGSTVPVTRGGLVAAVSPGGPAARAGVGPGDRIVAADAHPLADVVDWSWHAEGDRVAITVAAATGSERELVLSRMPGESWGIEFSAAIFDRVRTCRNDCAFCFMTQLPPGMRSSLYLRDDDFRLSFLHGNFVTLTNLSDEDVSRIIEQRLTPLYVSLHAVTPEVRARLVCAAKDRALERFDELLDAGIDLHVQIVLVPGVNDAEELDTTLTWIAQREGIASVGVVPLGYTRFQDSFSRSYQDPAAAAAVIAQVEPWRAAFLERDATRLVHLADEFYLNAGVPLPDWDAYEGAPQYENGIGLVRAFLDELNSLSERPGEQTTHRVEGARVTYVTGELFAPVLSAHSAKISELTGAKARILGVPNRLFGGNVSVAGLLTGVDIVGAIVADGAAGIYALPDVVLNADGLTLDDMTLDDIAAGSGGDVRLVSSDPAGLLLNP